MKTLVVTFVGKDQPGIVDKLAKLIRENAGNWQTSSLHQIAGSFAGVVEISIDDDKKDGLISSLDQFANLAFQTYECETETSQTPPTIVLDIMANDRTGIVQEIASVIHASGGNLVKLVSKQRTAAHSGQLLFKAKATVAITGEQASELLTQNLESIADDLIVDIVPTK